MANEVRNPQIQEPQKIPTPPDVWEKDPWVIVSRRIRTLYFPVDLLAGPVSKETRKEWRKPQPLPTPGTEFHWAPPAVTKADIIFGNGVTFLGSVVSSWALKSVSDPSKAPRTSSGEQVPPKPEDSIILYPEISARDSLQDSHFRNPETNQLRAGKVQEAMLRVIEYLKEDDDYLPKSKPVLWTAWKGYDAPELCLIRISELLNQTTEEGRKAYGIVSQSIKNNRDTRHLGALHDYAVRSAAGFTLATECRNRARLARPDTL